MDLYSKCVCVCMCVCARERRRERERENVVILAYMRVSVSELVDASGWECTMNIGTFVCAIVSLCMHVFKCVCVGVLVKDWAVYGYGLVNESVCECVCGWV